MSKKLGYARELIVNLKSMGPDETKEFNQAINSLRGDDANEFFHDIRVIRVAIGESLSIEKPGLEGLGEKIKAMGYDELRDFSRAIESIYVAMNNERDIPTIPSDDQKDTSFKDNIKPLRAKFLDTSNSNDNKLNT
ncbi:hypothetical protein [Burkholderia cepacia]|uniref:hypothetical protein n=1 Tax=Burkholderia cepacia TaxID=292 RepID=UPI001CF45956|nr:hypothetical protein [Burkholderia cepacia]MCA8351468.1 hypothetical protein [Burkholderia cepacia]